MRSVGLAGLMVLAALLETTSAAGNLCVNEGDLLASKSYHPDDTQTCQQFSDSFEYFGVDWSAASVCDDLKTFDRGVGYGPGEMWET